MRIAVTGATGRLGAQVIEILAASHDVVAVSRRPAPAVSDGTRLRAAVADYADLASLRTALHGVDTLVLISSDGEAVHVLRHHQNMIQAATDCGVGHIVALSGLDADPASPFCYAMSYGYTEQMLHNSGCAVSIARASIFTEFFIQFLTAARVTTEVRLPAADGRISLVSRADVGRCLAALAVDAPTGRHCDLTGPESLNLAAIASLAAQRWGTPVKYVDLTPADHLVQMALSGLESWWCYAFSTMFDSVREQRWAGVSSEVLRLTGQPPAAFRDMLARA
ncbi:NAD(P)H-binding protein [Nocardia terpenica]|uniref:NAD(P)H-binding protein n=1 Tax=Nocardia terpenica TaxID=455432 RepID=UPI00142E341D|nr:NAD(P)H-binding protein [Nocardia terpenica]